MFTELLITAYKHVHAEKSALQFDDQLFCL
jgi:hypothetical protein